MLPVATDGIAWSVSMSVRLYRPCVMKNGWTDRGAVWGVDSGGPRESCTRRGSISSHAKGQFWVDDVEIFPHAVDQRSDWPAAEAVEYHIKYSQRKISCDAASRQNYFTTSLFLINDKSSAVAEMGNRGHNRHGPKRGGQLCPFRGELGPRLVQYGRGRCLLPYQVASSFIQPFGHNRHGPKIGWGWLLYRYFFPEVSPIILSIFEK